MRAPPLLRRPINKRLECFVRLVGLLSLLGWNPRFENSPNVGKLPDIPSPCDLLES